jgi:peptidyl-prolyl cis-trans isomerase A (cyclophilin A)
MVKRTLLTISIVAIAFSVYGCKEKPIAREPVILEPAKAPAAKPVAKESATTPSLVKISTTMGDITVELFADKSPITVKNFLGYAESGFYDGTIFHRVIKGFMIQGGGMTPDMSKKPTLAPIKNETQNRVRNTRGTLAMARTGQLDSATSQFFINHKDNRSLDFDGPYKGYAVFGKVVSGMEIVDSIAMVQVGNKTGLQNVPVKTITINSIKVVSE